MLEINNKEALIEALQEEIETGLSLVGSTAIEDKLQEEVAETIMAFKEIGIKVWVLTGDKVETAINIGFSAGLLSEDMKMTTLNQEDAEKIFEMSEKLA